MERARLRDWWAGGLVLVAWSLLLSMPLPAQFIIDPYRFAAAESEPITDEANLIFRLTSESDITHSGAGTGVSAWDSTHGSAVSLVQATSGNQPLYQTNVFNGRPGVQFVSSDWLRVASSLMTVDGSTFYTVYVVAESSLTTAGALFVNSDTDTANSYYRGAIQTTGNLESRIRGATGGSVAAVTSTTVGADTPFVGTFVLGDGVSAQYNHFVYLNDAGEGSLIDQVTTATAADEFTVGMQRGTANISPLPGYIATIRIYSGEHSSGTQTTIVGEMTTYWLP